MLDTDAFNKALTADLGRTKQPNEDSTSGHYAAYLLQQNVLKKYSDGTTTKAAEMAALTKFTLVNDKVGRWTPPEEGTIEHRIMMRVTDLFDKQFHDNDGFPRIDVFKAFNVGMVGPGASIDATADNLVDKLFNSTLTCTHRILYSLYKSAIAGCRTWRKAEKFRTFIHSEYRIVEGNKLFYVPKETIIARTAATEPTLNMFGQLGYGTLIEERLKSCHDIDLSVQPDVNKWMARSGSLNQGYGTIDLSSASDTIGLALLAKILPGKMLRDLSLLRSPVTLVGSKRVKLNMVSTMGNGFTFPLQTWIFANLVLACMIELGVPVRDIYGKRRYSVFGDDIICPKEAYKLVARSLEAFGFTVNSTKSFNVGSFRESCGGDYFKGVNVRSVYLKKCTNDSHVYSLLNKLLDWQAVHKIALPNTMNYLKSLVKFRPIPLWEDETAGIRVPLAFLTNRKVSKRGNFYYHCHKQMVTKVVPEKHVVKRFYHAFKVAALHGSFRKGGVTPRVIPGNEVYKVVKRECPIYWDFTPDARYTIEERCNAFVGGKIVK